MTRPSQSERVAAYDIQVELVTRIGVQELALGTGSLREALDSLTSLSDFTRSTLHTYGIEPERDSGTETPSVQSIAHTLIHETITPFTGTWHPRLAVYETRCPASTTPLDHEAAWPDAASMRAELSALRAPLQRITEGLGRIAGADFGAWATK
ncbi:hypothetical protein ACOB87_37185 [Streptomyces sp. YS-B37]|uniref:hypothetical protein n=1 Tax=Streptomyces sp. YS-B37 TaxID=3407669 RepID=UPI003B501D9A